MNSIVMSINAVGLPVSVPTIGIQFLRAKQANLFDRLTVDIDVSVPTIGIQFLRGFRQGLDYATYCCVSVPTIGIQFLRAACNKVGFEP